MSSDAARFRTARDFLLAHRVDRWRGDAEAPPRQRLHQPFALEADELLLIVNAKAPEGRELAHDGYIPGMTKSSW